MDTILCTSAQNGKKQRERKIVLQHAIALTGGIATGKSTSAAMLKARGYEIVDADSIAHEVLRQKRGEIVEVFGEGVLEGGEICRKKLGMIVFGDAQKRAILEGIVLPRVNEEILSRAEILEARGEIYFLDIPLFFEQGGRERYPVKWVVVVYAPKPCQLACLMARNSLTQTEALQRIDAQLSIESKRAQSDFVIENLGDLEALEGSVVGVLTRLREVVGV